MHHYVTFKQDYTHKSRSFKKNETAPVSSSLKSELIKKGIAVEAQAGLYYDQFKPKTSEDLQKPVNEQ
jgi:hypothetical protein